MWYSKEYRALIAKDLAQGKVPEPPSLERLDE